MIQEASVYTNKISLLFYVYYATVYKVTFQSPVLINGSS